MIVQKNRQVKIFWILRVMFLQFFPQHTGMKFWLVFMRNKLEH